MTTRAANIQFLLSGLTSATTGQPVAGGTVYFYEAGTTTAKYVWTEIEKTNGYYSYALDAVGAAQLYGEGNYKLVVKDADGATVATLDNIRLEFPYYGIRSVTQTGNQLSQDDFLLVDTTGGAVTINALAAASWTRPLKIKRTSGTASITLDPSGSETIDGSATLVIATDAIVEIISNGTNLITVGYRSSFVSPDGNTQITVENGEIGFDISGVADVVTIDSDGITIKDNTNIKPQGQSAGIWLQGDNESTAYGGAIALTGRSRSVDPSTVTLAADGVIIVTVKPTGVSVTGGLNVNGTDLEATIAEVNSRCDGVPYSYSASTSGVTVSTLTWTTICTVDLGTVATDAWLIVEGSFDGTKTASTPTQLTLGMEKDSGTATFVDGSGNGALFSQDNVGTINTTGIRHRICGLIHVTSGGTLVLKLTAYTTHDAITIASAHADIGATLIKK